MYNSFDNAYCTFEYTRGILKVGLMKGVNLMNNYKSIEVHSVADFIEKSK
ncbi:hypothetical protein LEQ_1917 [Ligilactobacillus equi DPC 6820]|uniref:Uncharacterized protein n=1 Tax=Ligilactobacillus equi DPC 6820 TaxID=1392007 RepID=V7HZ64_9LACO|nr:hypothetical protein LEQ_1917 [Ligilactobacillus equi DPC 6820]